MNKGLTGLERHERVIDDRNVFFGWTIPLNAWRVEGSPIKWSACADTFFLYNNKINSSCSFIYLFFK